MNEVDRRSTLALIGGAALAGCAREPTAYQRLSLELYAPPPFPTGDRQAFMTALASIGCLAANGHNTQPWRFRLGLDSIFVGPDRSRRTPVVDPDDHHLHASLGCAAENIRIATRAHGFDCAVQEREDGVLIQVGPSRGTRADVALFAALPKRQSVRVAYDGSSISPADLAMLTDAAAMPGLAVNAFTSASDKRRLGDYVSDGNAIQMKDKAFVREMLDWVRFNESEAAKTRDGLFTGSSGNPQVPGWLGRTFFSAAYDADEDNRRYREAVDSSAVLFALVADENSPKGWALAGRAAQRIGIQAAAMGLKYAFINQPIEVAELRPRFAEAIGFTGRRPNLLIRVGRGPAMPRSLRRPVEAVIDRG